MRRIFDLRPIVFLDNIAGLKPRHFCGIYLLSRLGANVHASHNQRAFGVQQHPNALPARNEHGLFHHRDLDLFYLNAKHHEIRFAISLALPGNYQRLAEGIAPLVFERVSLQRYCRNALLVLLHF